MERLKEISMNPKEQEYFRLGCEFEELYQEIINYGDWNNDPILDSMWQDYDNDHATCEQLKIWVSRLSERIIEERDSYIEELNSEFKKPVYDLEYIGDQLVKI